MGCITRTYFRGGFVSKANELGALEVLQKIFSAARWKLAYIRVAEGTDSEGEACFSKKCERRESMGCITRTYFRGGFVSKANELGALEVLQKIFSAARWKLAYIRVA